MLAASPAWAEPRTFTATLTIEIAGFDPVSFTGGGTGDSVAGGVAAIPTDSIPVGFVSRLEQPLLGVMPGFAICAPGLPPLPSPAPTVFPIPETPGAETTTATT